MGCPKYLFLPIFTYIYHIFLPILNIFIHISTYFHVYFYLFLHIYHIILPIFMYISTYFHVYFYLFLHIYHKSVAFYHSLAQKCGIIVPIGLIYRWGKGPKFKNICIN